MNVYTISRHIAAAIASDVTINNLCETLYGRKLRVHMVSLGSGTNDEENGGPTPYCIVNPTDFAGGNEASRNTCGVGILICLDASQNPDGTFTSAFTSEEASDGVFEVSGKDNLHVIGNLIKEICEKGGHGANPTESAVAMDGSTAYPVQYAVVSTSYQQTRSF